MMIKEQMDATKKMMNTLTSMIDDIEWVIGELESKDERTEADDKVLRFAKHLQKWYK